LLALVSQTVGQLGVPENLDDIETELLAVDVGKAMSLRMIALLGLLTVQPLQAQAASEAQELVDKTRLTVEKLLADPDFAELRPYVERAHAVLVIPQLIKGGFIIGGEGGSGTLLAKGTDGTWSSPAFYTLAAGSIGLQIGGQVSEVIFTVMNEGALNAMASPRGNSPICSPRTNSIRPPRTASRPKRVRSRCGKGCCSTTS